MEVIDFDNLKSHAELESEVTTTTPPVVEESADEGIQLEEISESTDEESSEEHTEGTDKDSTPWGKPNSVPKGVRDRFSKLSGDLRGANSRIAQMEAYFQHMQQQAQAQSQQRVPSKEDFIKAGKTEGEYINYLVQVNVSTQARQMQEQLQQQARQRASADELSAKWDTTMAKAREDLADYDDVIADSDVNLPVDTMRYLVTNEVGPYISYTIAKDTNLQAQINALPVNQRHAAVLQVEKMVKNWLSKKAPVAPSAPVTRPAAQVQPPNKPRAPKSLGAGGKKNLDPASASIEDWLGIN